MLPPASAAAVRPVRALQLIQIGAACDIVPIHRGASMLRGPALSLVPPAGGRSVPGEEAA